MIVTVTEVEPAPGSTVWTASGIDEETGDHITFGGDWRAMEGLATLVGDVVEVDDWQVLSRTPAST